MMKIQRRILLQWLDASIMYLISDSVQVSPVQCFFKKGGVIVVENDKDMNIASSTQKLQKDTERTNAQKFLLACNTSYKQIGSIFLVELKLHCFVTYYGYFKICYKFYNMCCCISKKKKVLSRFRASVCYFNKLYQYNNIL